MAALLAFPDDPSNAYRRWWRGIVMNAHETHGEREEVDQALLDAEPTAAARWKVYGQQASTCEITYDPDGPEVRGAVEQATQQLHALWTFRLHVLLGQMTLDEVSRQLEK